MQKEGGSEGPSPTAQRVCGIILVRSIARFKAFLVDMNKGGWAGQIKCDPIVIYDAYGQSLDRTQACYDPSASLVIRITDACPCNYPNNPQSNKRWCCGDTMHIDLSVYAYEKLADREWCAIQPCLALTLHANADFTHSECEVSWLWPVNDSIGTLRNF